MRIAKVCAEFLPVSGGIPWKVHYLAAEYTRRGHEVIVFTSKRRFEARSVELPVIPDYEIVRCGLRFPGVDRVGISKLLFRGAILRRNRNRPFDVIHCHHLGLPTQFGVAAKSVSGVPVVATTCGGDVMSLPHASHGARLKQRFDRIIRSNLNHVDVIGSINKSIRQDLERMGTGARIVDIPNGVPWDEFQIGPSELLKQLLGLDTNVTILLSVGQNRPVKGYDLGIRAFATVAEEFGDAVYVLVGKYMTRLSPLVAELNLRGRVHLLEQVPFAEIPKVFRSADVFLSPSLMEGFSQVNAQALASGLPCVLTDAPGNQDAGDGGGALIATSEDVESIARSIASLLGDRAERQRLGEAAHSASKRYAWSRIAEEYLEVFEDLAGR